MAEDLGDIASLLGSSFVQTARMNEEEQNEYRKRAMRQQLLYAFAAPLAQEVGKGVTSFAGDLLLGNNSKDFFNTREGVSLMRRINTIGNARDKMDTQVRDLEKIGGGNARRGAFDQAVQDATTELQNKYRLAGIPNMDLEIAADIETMKPTIRDNVNDEFDKFEKFYESIGSVPNAEQFLKLTEDGPLNRTVGQKIGARISSFFTGRDPKETQRNAIRLALTGNNPEILGSDWFKAFEEGNFNEEFREQLNAARNLRGDDYDFAVETNNSFSALLEKHPELKEKYLALGENADAIRNKTMDNLKTQKLLRDTPSASVYLKEARARYNLAEDEFPSIQQLQETAVRSIEGIGEDNSERFIFTYLNGADNASAVDSIRNTLSRKISNGKKDFQDLNQIDQEKINTASKNAVAGYLRFFNQDLEFVKRKMKENENFSFNLDLIDDVAIEEAAETYLNTIISNSKTTRLDPGILEGTDMISKITSLFQKEEQILKGTVSAETRQEVRTQLFETLSDVDAVESLQEKAEKNGRYTQRQVEASGELLSMNRLSRVVSAVKEEADKINNSSTSRSNKLAQIQNLINRAKSQSEKSAKDKGFSGLDNEFYILLDSFLEDVPSSSDNLNLMSIPSF